MKCHKISISNGNITGLSKEEMTTLFNFATKNQDVQGVISTVAEKVQESIAVDAHLLNKLVESGEVSKSDAYELMHEYYELSNTLNELNEGFIDDAKKFGSDAYAKAGVAFGKAQMAVGKAIGNILGWMKAHPRLTIGLTVVALLIIFPAQAFASSQVQVTDMAGNHNFYATSGTDLNLLAEMWLDAKDDPELKKKLHDALAKIATDSVLVLPSGEHFTGDTADMLVKITSLPNDAQGAVLLSTQSIPGTFETTAGYKVLKGLVDHSIPMPGKM